MVVMMIVGGSPDTTRAEGHDADKPHQTFRQFGFGQDGVVLLGVINDEKSQNEKPGEQTAQSLSDRMIVPKRPDLRGSKQKQRG